MFVQTWNKYLPAIKILLKRSINGEQTLNMNHTDFQRATGGRKIKFAFNVTLHKGRIQNVISPSSVAKDLLAALQQDDTTNRIIRQQDFKLALNNNFQLLIKDITEPLLTPDTVTNAEDNSSEMTADTDDKAAIEDETTNAGN